jgi:hypothetical protein
MLLISVMLLFALIYRSAVADGAQRITLIRKWLNSGTSLKTDWLTRWPSELCQR